MESFIIKISLIFIGNIQLTSQKNFRILTFLLSELALELSLKYLRNIKFYNVLLFVSYTLFYYLKLFMYIIHLHYL